MKFSTKDFFRKCDQNLRNLGICSHLLKQSLIENFTFSSVLRHGFVDERQRKTIIQKKPQNKTPCTLLLFKASAFLQIFFPRNLLFRKVLRTSAFLNSKCLTFHYLFISSLKYIHQKHQLKEHTFLYLLSNLFFQLK